MRYGPEQKRIRSDDDLKRHSDHCDLRRPSIAAVSGFEKSTMMHTQASDNVRKFGPSGFVTEDSHANSDSRNGASALIRQQLAEVRSLLAVKEEASSSNPE